jgi:hypothetical protein
MNMQCAELRLYSVRCAVNGQKSALRATCFFCQTVLSVDKQAVHVCVELHYYAVFVSVNGLAFFELTYVNRRQEFENHFYSMKGRYAVQWLVKDVNKSVRSMLICLLFKRYILYVDIIHIDNFFNLLLPTYVN